MERPRTLFRVLVVEGIYRMLEGDVIDENDETVLVRFDLRPLSVVARLPKKAVTAA
jgi:hypothetical protein